MAYTSWRGVFGLVKPTRRPGSLEECVRMLPEGIGIIPLLLDIQSGTKEEFTNAVAQYEPKIAELAEQEVDVIMPDGSAPLMIMGYEKEKALVKQWEKKYKTPIFTPGQNYARAIKAMGCKRLVNIAYTTWDDQDLVAAYFKPQGITMVAREVFPVHFQKVQQLSSKEIYAFIKKCVAKHGKSIDGIFIQGGAWRCLDILEILEQDTGLPVIHSGPTRAWEVMRRLHVRQPVKGYGRLLADMPEG
jgi:maleate isomerase